MILLVTGCASGPGYEEYASRIEPLAEGTGRIYIYRTALVGAAMQPTVYVNSRQVGKAKPGGFFYVDRPPGNYEISASTEARRSLTFRLDAGDERYVRLEMKMGLLVGHIKPVLVEQEVGADQIQGTSYIGPQD